MHKRIPNDAHAMIIGAMKCGTSSLYDYLSGHPQICPAITKEPEFFSENQAHGVPVIRYSDLFSYDGSIHRYTLDGSTGYTKYPSEPNVAKNIYDYGISPRLIYIIRNPFDRIESHFNFMQRSDKWPLGIVDEHLINTCDYFLQIEQYREFFPVSNLLLLDFDGLKCDPHATLVRVYNFLNLSHSYFPDVYKVQNQTQYVSKTENRPQQAKIDRLLRSPLRAGKESLGHSMQKVAPGSKRILTRDERELVFNRLKHGMHRLTSVYGFDASKWGF